jgi:uncharacterized protein YabE (DUF348 family)
MNGLYLTFIKRTLPLKQLAILLILSAFAVISGIKLYNNISKDVKIIDNGKPIVVKTMGTSVEQALERLGISIRPDDYISMPLDANLDNDSMNVINIKRAVPVRIVVDGQLREVWSYKDTVEEVIEENGITLNPLDRFEGLTASSQVTADMEIRVVRVNEEITAEKVEIPFTVVEKPNNTMNEGDTRIVVNGENGVREKYYKITYEDGKPVDRLFVNEDIVKAPVDRVVEYGTVMNFRNSRGELVRYSKVLDMRATAYTSSFEDTGKHPDHPAFGITYTGMKAREGIIAVDPKVIPLGTKLYVEVPGPAPDYGFAIAGDIGSAIKGKNIDLYFDTPSEVRQWGRRKVVVYILNEQSDTRWKDNVDPCK